MAFKDYKFESRSGIDVVIDSIGGVRPMNLLEKDLLDRIRELGAEIAELRSVLDNAQVAQYALELKARAEAAEAEVERLRAGGCARDQRLTQYCAEAVAAEAKLRAVGELRRFNATTTLGGGYGGRCPVIAKVVLADELDAILRGGESDE